MKFVLSKTVIIAGLTLLGAIVADLIKQNPTYASVGAVIGAVIASLIEFEQAQPAIPKDN